ncbi:MAG: TIGR01777 family oxidoreductase [Chitinophagaceae bacterium]
MPTITITGGTGLIGQALTEALLNKGYHVIIVSRKLFQKSNRVNLSFATWNVEKQSVDREAISKADYIIHLAGAGVADKRWTRKRKQEIISSRVDSSRLIANSLQTIPNKVKAVISSSATGWYGADAVLPAGKPFTENDPADDSFLGNTCKLWEESISPVSGSGIRLVIFRTGIVLSKKGGALKEFLKPLRFGIAAILGNGKQMISWIHIDDLTGMYIKAIEDASLNGVYNATSPHPVSNKELIMALAKTRKFFYIPFHIPSFLLKWIFGKMSIEVLKSTTVSSQKIIDTGFSFQFPEIKQASRYFLSEKN